MSRSIGRARGDAFGAARWLRAGAAAGAAGAMIFVAGCASDSGATPSADTSDATATTATDASPTADAAEQTQGPDATAAMPEDIATATSTLNVPVRPNAVLTGQGLVLQMDDDPPVLCLAPYIETYPPQCDGPLILGLDWEEMPPYSMAQDIRWGEAQVVGTFDGATFTLTQPPGRPTLPVEPGGGTGADPLTTICDSPYADGAATGLDPLSSEADAALGEAIALLEANKDYASSFTSDGSTVLNVLLVEDADVEATTADLREVWPGGLCVEAQNVPPRDAVYRAMDTMSRADLPDVFSWTASPEGGIEIVVLRADEDMIIRIYSILATLLDQDDIHITSALTPLDPQPQR
ncbi:MAG: hypothetical protein WBG57_09335 [Ornithinimicrobium sp.]